MDANNAWRQRLPSDSRKKIFHLIMDFVQKYMRPRGQESMGELLKIALCFEERAFNSATDQQDYLRKISSKMLILETNAQGSPFSLDRILLGPELDANSNTWRQGLPSDSRQRVVRRVMDTLQRHIPPTGQEAMGELLKIAWRFEEKIFNAATDQQDYLRKLSLKLLSLERMAQGARPSLDQGSDNIDDGFPVEVAAKRTQKFRVRWYDNLCAKVQIEHDTVWQRHADLQVNPRYPLRNRATDCYSLLPGLPDSVCEVHIWPRLQKSLEDAVVVIDGDPITLLKCIHAISRVNSKWRHLATNCKLWACIKYTDFYYRQISADRLLANFVARLYFRYMVGTLPPISVLAQMPLSDLADFHRSWIGVYGDQDRQSFRNAFFDKDDIVDNCFRRQSSSFAHHYGPHLLLLHRPDSRR